MIRVLVVDDNAVIRSGLSALIDSAPDLTVVGEAATGREAIERAGETAPDVVLLDVRMPVMDGVTAAGPLSEQATVLMLTYTDDRDAVAGALWNGAAGYLVHGQFAPNELLRAIRDVAESRPALSPHIVPLLIEELRDGRDAAAAPQLGLRAGGHDLTPREAEVMDAIAAGLANGEIAERLFLAPKTVKNTINRIYVKLGVTARGEAIARWVGTAAES